MNLKKNLKIYAPKIILILIVKIKYYLSYYYNKITVKKGDKYCPVCESEIIQFNIYNDSSSCPICKASERFRIDWCFMKKNTNLLENKHKKLLHIAPEIFFLTKFEKNKYIKYYSVDIESPRAKVNMDITNITFPDNFFDCIYCSHVLEHIEDDRKALRELFRVCKNDGWAILQVPLTVNKTFEDPTITNPAERLKVFGNRGHVRRCGLDYADRIQEMGFDVTISPLDKILSCEDIKKMGFINKDRYVFYCKCKKEDSKKL